MYFSSLSAGIRLRDVLWDSVTKRKNWLCAPKQACSQNQSWTKTNNRNFQQCWREHGSVVQQLLGIRKVPGFNLDHFQLKKDQALDDMKALSLTLFETEEPLLVCIDHTEPDGSMVSFNIQQLHVCFSAFPLQQFFTTPYENMCSFILIALSCFTLSGPHVPSLTPTEKSYLP